MLVAISASGPKLNSPVDQRFGRCAYFVLFDEATGEGSVFTNCSRTESHGAGIRAAQSIIDRGVKVVLTGRVGPKAQQALEAGKIDIVTGADGTVEEALEEYRRSSPRSFGSDK